MRRVLAIGLAVGIVTTVVVSLIGLNRHGAFILRQTCALARHSPGVIQLWLLAMASVAIAGMAAVCGAWERPSKWSIWRILGITCCVLVGNMGILALGPRSFRVDIGWPSWDTYWMSDTVKLDVVVLAYLFGVLCSLLFAIGVLAARRAREEVKR